MAVKLLEVDNFGLVHLQRKKGLKNICLRVNSAGQVRVSAPWLVPRKFILAFIRSKQDFILSQQDKLLHDWQSGQMITPICELRLESTQNQRPSQSLRSSQLILFIPSHYSESHQKQYIEKSVSKIQKNYCQEVIAKDLAELAAAQGLGYSALTVKSLKGRWGSCDTNKRIILNSHLSSLPPEVVKYVLAHELAHTQHLNHSQQFWKLVSRIEPNFKSLRKSLKEVQPGPRPYSNEVLVA